MGKMPRKLSSCGVILGFLLFVIFQMSSVPIQAETQSPEANVDQEVSTFSNPAQAAHAENLAAAAAKNDPNVHAAFAALEAAEKALQDATASHNENAIALAEAAYDSAKANFEAALAQAAGVALDEIADMRSDGLGWGQIAHELGLHPGLLGLGHTRELELGLHPAPVGFDRTKGATERNMQTGLAIGHGVSNRSGSDGGRGLGNAVGQGGSQSSGHGGGQGGGHGGGHGGGGGNGGGGGHGAK